MRGRSGSCATSSAYGLSVHPPQSGARQPPAGRDAGGALFLFFSLGPFSGCLECLSARGKGYSELATVNLLLRCKHVALAGRGPRGGGDGRPSTEPADGSRVPAQCHEHPRAGHQGVAPCRRIRPLPPRATQVASKPARVVPPQPACPSSGARMHAARPGVAARGTRAHEPWPTVVRRSRPPGRTCRQLPGRAQPVCNGARPPIPGMCGGVCVSPPVQAPSQGHDRPVVARRSPA